MPSGMLELQGTKRHYGKGYADRMAIGERVLLARVTHRELMADIAKREGISVPTAYRYMRAALERREIEAVDVYRKHENEALDSIERQNDEQIVLAERLAAKALDAGNLDGIVKAAMLRDRAISQRIRLAERRARLNGLDAPVQVQATVTHLGEVDAELADLVAQAQRAAEETRP